LFARYQHMNNPSDLNNLFTWNMPILWKKTESPVSLSTGLQLQQLIKNDKVQHECTIHYSINEKTCWRLIDSGGVWFEVLKFNKHCSTFVLFDKKFPILN
jgi:hypothetical protein